MEAVNGWWGTERFLKFWCNCHSGHVDCLQNEGLKLHRRCVWAFFIEGGDFFNSFLACTSKIPPWPLTLQDTLLCYIQINIKYHLFLYPLRLAKEFSFHFLDTAGQWLLEPEHCRFLSRSWMLLIGGKKFLIKQQDDYQTRGDKKISII